MGNVCVGEALRVELSVFAHKEQRMKEGPGIFTDTCHLFALID